MTGERGSRSRFRLGAALALAGGLAVLPGRFGKRIEHLHLPVPAPVAGTAHVNLFREWPGGGSWILLENPLEYCFLYAGFAPDGAGAFARGDERAVVRTVYRVNGAAYGSRFTAAAAKLLAVHRFAEPVEAVIEVVERNDDHELSIVN